MQLKAGESTSFALGLGDSVTVANVMIIIDGSVSQLVAASATFGPYAMGALVRHLASVPALSSTLYPLVCWLVLKASTLSLLLISPFSTMAMATNTTIPLWHHFMSESHRLVSQFRKLPAPLSAVFTTVKVVARA